MGEAAALMPPNTHPQAYLTEIALKYKLRGPFYMDMWPIADSMVVMSEPGPWNQAMVEQAAGQHPVSDAFMEPVTGSGVIATVNGPLWKKLHNSMLPAFSWSHIRSLTGVIQDETMHFRETMGRLADSGRPFSMEKESAKLIFDVIARVIFNFSLNAQTEGSQTLDDLRELVKVANAQLSFNPIVRLKARLRRRTILARLNPSILAKIDERFGLLTQEKIVPSRKDPYSILDLMLRQEVMQEGSDSSGQSQEDRELLLTNVKALLLGGHGTTTNTWCSMLTLLSKHPEAVEKIREEHSRVFGPDYDTAMETLTSSPEKLQELEYTGAVIREAMRMFPVGFGPKIAGSGLVLYSS